MSYHGYSGILEDIVSVVTPPPATVEQGKKLIDDRANQLLDEVLSTKSGAQLQQYIEDAVAAGAEQKVREKAPALIALTMGGGALGGFLGSLGIVGKLAAGGLVAYGVFSLMPPAPQPRDPRAGSKKRVGTGGKGGSVGSYVSVTSYLAG